MAATMMYSANELSSVFADLEPVPQDDGPNPVCRIDYSGEFTKAYDYMRAVLKSAEKSDRALRLTGLCLKLNPANYTIWHFRRQCLEAVQTPDNALDQITQDLQLAATLGGANPKNYQIWYHRRALLESAGVGKESQDQAVNSSDMDAFVSGELDYVAQVLGQDSKNYHAWSHRQWIIRTVNKHDLWEKEFEFAHKLIQEDPRNNSAWNQRWFVAHQGGNISTLDLATAKKEADYAIQGARLDPYNESPWRYLIGVIKEQCKVAEDKNGFLDEYDRKACELNEVLSTAEQDPDACSNLVSARIDLMELKGDSSSLEKALELASSLANDHDLIRKRYWLLRMEEIKQELQ